MNMSRATKKYNYGSAMKSKSKALRYFKVDPVLKIVAAFYIRLDLCMIHIWLDL